jgi:hypothetical protein
MLSYRVKRCLQAREATADEDGRICANMTRGSVALVQMIELGISVSFIPAQT